ncbi:MAG: CBS domain-containing protein, partial [Anaerolineales bacterium]
MPSGSPRLPDLLTSSRITVEGDTPVVEAARLMVERKIHGFPVMDGDNVVDI